MLKGSLTDVLSFPAIKDLKKNEWAEEDGSEYDLSNIVLNSKDITLSFCVSEDNYTNFINLLKQNTYNDFLFETINTSFRYRLASVTRTSYIDKSVFLDIKFSEDNPFHGYTYEVPTLTTTNSNTLLDKKNISIYGVRLLQGSKQEIISKSEIKTPLIIQNQLINGDKVGNVPLFFKEKTVRLKCNIHQKLNDFFKGYNAFFYDLIRPNERTLTYEGINYKFVYKNSKVTGILIDEHSIWVDFDLELIFI